MYSKQTVCSQGEQEQLMFVEETRTTLLERNGTKYIWNIKSRSLASESHWQDYIQTHTQKKKMNMRAQTDAKLQCYYPHVFFFFPFLSMMVMSECVWNFSHCFLIFPLFVTLYLSCGHWCLLIFDGGLRFNILI